MSKGRQKIRFEGLLQKNVLGTFSVIRGFADLRDLAAVSVAIPYEGSGMGSGTGYQQVKLRGQIFFLDFSGLEDAILFGNNTY